MIGEELIQLINNKPELKSLPIFYTIKELLRKNLINPSELIDAHKSLLEEEIHRYKSHFTDAAISSIQLFNGKWKGEDYEKAKKRFFYNTSFCRQFPRDTSSLTDDEKRQFSDMFETNYGFRPEEYRK